MAVYSPSSLGMVETPSIIRYGLTGLRPVRVRNIIKKFGVKFEQILIKFKPTELPNTYTEYISDRYKEIFSIIPVPEYFDSQKLIDFYVRKSLEIYEKDKELSKMVEEIKKTKGSLSPLIDFIVFCKNRYNESIEETYDSAVRIFYMSDFPFIILSDFMRSIHVFAEFLNLLHSILMYYQKRMIGRARSDDKYFYKMTKMMKKELNQAIDLIDGLLFSNKTLFCLISIWNAKSYKELESLKFISINEVPKNAFEKFYNVFKREITNTRYIILKHPRYRINEKMNIKPPQPEFDFTEYIREILTSYNVGVSNWKSYT